MQRAVESVRVKPHILWGSNNWLHFTCLMECNEIDINLCFAIDNVFLEHCLCFPTLNVIEQFFFVATSQTLEFDRKSRLHGAILITSFSNIFFL